MDRGAQQATGHGVTESRTRLKRLSPHAPSEQLQGQPRGAVGAGFLGGVEGRQGALRCKQSAFTSFGFPVCILNFKGERKFFPPPLHNRVERKNSLFYKSF